MKTRLFTAWLAFLPAYCQELGGLRGSVIDESTAPIANADVQLKHHRSSAVYKKVQTARDGTFQFKDIPAGKYDVMVISPGFPSVLRIDIRVRPSEMFAFGTITLPYVPTACEPVGQSYLPKIENSRFESGVSQIVGSIIETEAAQPLSGASVVAKDERRLRMDRSKRIRRVGSL